jgi:hypothetical protein
MPTQNIGKRKLIIPQFLFFLVIIKIKFIEVIETKILIKPQDVVYRKPISNIFKILASKNIEISFRFRPTLGNIIKVYLR